MPKVKIDILDDTVEIPVHVEPVFQAILDSDFDEPLPRCGEAITWLSERGLVVTGVGEVFPVSPTLSGRLLARSKGYQTMDSGMERANA